MVNLSIPGMTCGHCKTAVTAALTSVPGVAKVVVDLDGRTARVEGIAPLEALVSVLDQAGYPATLAE